MYENLNKICRVCLEEGVLLSIFNGNDHLSFRIMACASVQVYKNDGLPSLICNGCILQLDAAYNFRQKIEQSDEQLRKVLGLALINTDKIENTNYQNFIDYGSSDIKTEIDIDDDNTNNITDSHSDKDSTSGSKDSESNRLEILSKIKSKQNSGNTIKTENPIDFLEIITPKKRGRKKKGKIESNKNKEDIDVHIEVPVDGEKKKRGRKRGSKLSIPKGEKRARDTTRKHMCDTCGKTFLYFSNLADHSRIHTGDKPFVCTVCGNRFAQSGHLMIHARTHTGVKPYQCEFCPRAFTVSHALKKHLRTHTGERPYSCSVCTKAFVTSYHLSNHFKRHTGEKNFKCDWPGCGIGFVNISEMKRHRARHEKPNEPYASKLHLQSLGQFVPKVEQNLTPFIPTFTQRNELPASFPIRIMTEELLSHTTN